MAPEAVPVPTNIITGFLGVGKTTAIQALMAAKPAEERWAVLVNEFGEVGIDGSLLTRRKGEQEGIYIREVPGGCMCCSAGLPMQIALNMLLARAKPHRLLIEPTGLGHPREVMATLAAPHYREHISLRTTATLVDARKVHQDDFTGHPTFMEQLAIADVIVASKADLYGPEDLPGLLSFLEDQELLADRTLYPVAHGKLRLEWLDSPTRQDLAGLPIPPAPAAGSPTESATELPPEGFLCRSNQADGFYSRGWVFSNRWVFDAAKLRRLLADVEADRVKGVFVTSVGVAGFNKAEGALTELALDDCIDSRLECISRNKAALDRIDSALFDCVISR